jgi:hypothetical protein
VAELNVTASARFDHDVGGKVYALLTVLVKNEQGTPLKDLTPANFGVQAERRLQPVTVDVEYAGAIEPGTRDSNYPRGLYRLLAYRSDGQSFDLDHAWSFIIHVVRVYT